MSYSRRRLITIAVKVVRSSPVIEPAATAPASSADCSLMSSRLRPIRTMARVGSPWESEANASLS